VDDEVRMEPHMNRIALIALSCLPLGIFTSAAPRADTTYKGFISDKRCGAHVDSECNKRCFEQGETPVLVVDGTGAILEIANADKVTSMPGAHVEIVGEVDSKEQTLVVVTVKALK
jgi:hypothetical protein